MDKQKLIKRLRQSADPDDALLSKLLEDNVLEMPKVEEKKVAEGKEVRHES